MMTMCCCKKGLIVLQVEMLSLSIKRYVSYFFTNEKKTRIGRHSLSTIANYHDRDLFFIPTTFGANIK